MQEINRHYMFSRPEQTRTRKPKQTTARHIYHKYATPAEVCSETVHFSFERSPLILIGAYLADTNLNIEIMNSPKVISALHAGIHWSEDEKQYKLQDVSRDGTNLNGVRVQSLRLIPIRNGDTLEMPSTNPRVKFKITITDISHKGIILDAQPLKPEVQIRSGRLKI
jgi:hypothetical protein